MFPQATQSWGSEKEEYEIDPAKYVDSLITKIISSLSDTVLSGKNIQDGYILYTINVDMLETICRSNKWLTDNYDSIVKEKLLEAKIDSEKVGRDTVIDLRVAKVKFSILLKEIFDSRMKDEELNM